MEAGVPGLIDSIDVVHRIEHGPPVEDRRSNQRASYEELRQPGRSWPRRHPLWPDQQVEASSEHGSQQANGKEHRQAPADTGDPAQQGSDSCE